MPSPVTAASAESFCYLTTVGRVTGRPHHIEIWFADVEGRAYLLAGGGDRTDWVRNLRRRAAVQLRVGEREGPATARVVDDPDDPVQTPARTALRTKYEGPFGGSLEDWARDALLVEVTPEPGW